MRGLNSIGQIDAYNRAGSKLGRQKDMPSLPATCVKHNLIFKISRS